MSAPEIRGWCPGALRPMLSGDGLVVRVRPVGGRLSPEQAKGIARLAALHGNGLIDLSARANVQLRGVRAADHAALIAGLAALGLIDATPEIEARRNIVVTPFWAEGDGAQALARDLAGALARDGAPKTPGKFGYAVDCGAVPVLADVSADVRIERAPDGGLIVRADGAETAAAVTAATAAAVAQDLARWFIDTGGVSDGRGRMAAHQARGAVLPDLFTEVSAVTRAPFAPPGPGRVAAGFLMALEFGQMRAETMSVLARSGALRITPWRMILIEGARRAPAIAGMIADPADPLLRVVACTGAPGCPQAHVATRPLARALCSALKPGQLLHVSGCAKGCAHPGPAALTLVGRAGGRVDLIRDGGAADAPACRGLVPGALTPAFLNEVADAAQL